MRGWAMVRGWGLVDGVRLLLGLALAAPLVVTTGPLPETVDYFVVGKAVWSRTLIEVAVGLWLILLLRDARYRPPKSWLLGIFGGYLVIALLAALFGVSPTRSIWSDFTRMNGWIGLAHWFAFLLVSVSVFRTWEQWRGLLNFAVIVGIGVGLLGLAEVGGAGWLPYRGADTGGAETGLPVGTLGNSTFLGGFAVVNLFIAGGLLVSSFMGGGLPSGSNFRASGELLQARGIRVWGRLHIGYFLDSRCHGNDGGQYGRGGEPQGINGWRLVWLAAIVLALLMLWFSGSRGALLGLAAGLAVCGAAYGAWGEGRGRRLAAGAAAGLAAIGLAAGAVVVLAERNSGEGWESTLLSRLSASGRDKSVGNRLNAARLGIEGFQERPLLGWGPDNFGVVYDRYVSAPAVARAVTTFDRAHNKPIEELTTKGILGLTGYAAIWVWVFAVYAGKGRRLTPGRRVFFLLLGGGMTAYFVQNLTLFDTPGTLPQLMALLGFVGFAAGLPAGESGKESDGEEKVGDARKDGRSGNQFRMMGAFDRFRMSGMARRIGSSVLVKIAAIGIIALLTAAVVYGVNVRTYLAAQWAVEARDERLSWGERFAAFDAATEGQPGLANRLRIRMFREIDEGWDGLTAAERTAALELVLRHGATGLAQEPREWRLYVLAGDVARQAGELARARLLLESGAAMAPNKIEVQRRWAMQLAAEGDYAGGLRVIEEYLAAAPAARLHFADLRAELTAAAGAGGE